MTLNRKAYVVLTGVFILSFGSLFLLPDGHELLRSVIAAPGVTALLGILLQLMRDQADYEKQLEAQRREFQFTLGAASHMANAAFDKHADFCEKMPGSGLSLSHQTFADSYLFTSLLTVV